MNVAVLKTKAEQALTETFAAVADQLPGGEAVAKVRNAAIGRFGTLGLPHRRIEAWKYTDLRAALKEALPPLIGVPAAVGKAELDAALGPFAGIDATRVVFIDGAYAPSLSGIESLAGVAGAPLAHALGGDVDDADLLRLKSGFEDPILALNTAYATDGAVIGIAKQAKLAKPLLFVFARASRSAHLLATRNVVSVGDGAEATIIEAFIDLPGAAADAQHTAVTELDVGSGASVLHVKCAADNGRASQLVHWLVDVGADADYRAFQFTAGVGLVRNQLAVNFKGEGAKIDLSGAFLARAHEHIDTTLVVDHALPRCTSRELFKGVLADEAQGVFQGKVIVRPDAQKSDGKQMAQVLMLSPNAEFDSKPELEIYADDVICGHGSTSADIDEDQLFYCRARGIPEDEARALLIESFIGEALEKVEREDVREALSELARRWLSEPAAVRTA